MRLAVRMRLAVALACMAGALLAAAPAQAAKRTVPQGFYGIFYAGDDIETAPAPTQERAWDLMAAAGVESARIVVNWEMTERQQGGPLDWSRTDGFVANAARRGISVMPTVMYAPNWAKQYPNVVSSPPRGTGSYAAFLRKAIARYGPDGTFWKERPQLPKRPVRHWQIWNEPDLTDHWWRTDKKFVPNEAKRYGALLRASSRAIRKADPGAKVVLAGLSNFAWETAAGLLKHGGVRGAFDIAAVHMFPGNWRNVTVIVKRFRQALDKGGARGRPIWVTEMTWPAAKGRTNPPPFADSPYYRNFITDEPGARDRLAGAYKRLSDPPFRRANRLERVFWFSASSKYAGGSIWDYVGLTEVRGGTIYLKPTYEGYQREARRDQGCTKDTSGRCQ